MLCWCVWELGVCVMTSLTLVAAAACRFDVFGLRFDVLGFCFVIQFYEQRQWTTNDKHIHMQRQQMKLNHSHIHAMQVFVFLFHFLRSNNHYLHAQHTLACMRSGVDVYERLCVRANRHNTHTSHRISQTHSILLSFTVPKPKWHFGVFTYCVYSILRENHHRQTLTSLTFSFLLFLSHSQSPIAFVHRPIFPLKQSNQTTFKL